MEIEAGILLAGGLGGGIFRGSFVPSPGLQ